jgi:hypothetical protein
MHASIHRFKPPVHDADGVAQHGRRLAAALSELPGFVSFVMLETEADGLAAVAIFDDAAGLQTGGAAIMHWLQERATGLDATTAMPLLSGEIIVQRGL